MKRLYYCECENNVIRNVSDLMAQMTSITLTQHAHCSTNTSKNSWNTNEGIHKQNTRTEIINTTVKQVNSSNNSKSRYEHNSKSVESSTEPSSFTAHNNQVAQTQRNEFTLQKKCDVLQKELKETQHALRMTRLRLRQLEKNASIGPCETLLKQFNMLDRSAFQAASELRYTGFALQSSHDHLLLELRRILAIGLEKTSETSNNSDSSIDKAAIEAGALNYIRANIGYRADHIRDSPAVLLKLDNIPSSEK